MEDAAATSARATVDLATSTLAELLRRYCGDLVTGLHLVGSVALGDFRPGRSDLDFVAVLSRRPTDADIDALAIVHRSYGTDPTFPRLGGIWITDADLAAGPDATPDGPSSQDNDFLASDRGNRNPVTWFELRHAVSVIGTLDRDALWHDRERLVAWVRENAASYWRRWLADAEKPWTGRGLGMFGRATPMWGVLGISRQHYTVATGEIASKSTAGGWALETFDGKYRKIVEETLAYRRGAASLYANPFARRREALAFVEMAVEAVVGEPGPRGSTSSP